MSCGRCLPFGLDCSPEAQDERRRRLQALMGKLYSGVSSVSDRGRSVAYRDFDGMRPLIARLMAEIEACETGIWPRRRSLSYLDLVKGL